MRGDIAALALMSEPEAPFLHAKADDGSQEKYGGCNDSGRGLLARTVLVLAVLDGKNDDGNHSTNGHQD